MSAENKEKRWCDPVDGVIYVPDEHDSLINSIAFQHKLNSISKLFGENEMYARMVYVAEKHFKKIYGIY